MQLSSQSRSWYKGKTAKVLTVSSRSLRQRGDNLWNPDGAKVHQIVAYLEEWLYTGDDSSCSPSEKKHRQRGRTIAKSAVTGFVNCAFLFFGGQWFGKTSLWITPAYFLETRTPVHEDGGHDHDAPLVHVVLCNSGFNSSSVIFRSWTVYKMGTTCTGQSKETGNVLPKRYNSIFTKSHESIPTAGYNIILVWMVSGPGSRCWVTSFKIWTLRDRRTKIKKNVVAKASTTKRSRCHRGDNGAHFFV